MPRILRNGDQGADVRAVQDVLNFQIRRMAPLVVDGRFGSKTQTRVQEFQRGLALTPDGVVGPFTTARLFETEQLPLGLLLSPAGRPAVAGSNALQPPRLIPPLSLPGLPAATPSFPILRPVQLFPSSSTPLPPLTAQGQSSAFLLKVPVRNDPQDPTTRSQQQVLQLVQTLPFNFPFRAQIIGAVPQPVRSPGDPDVGFKWGVDPLFELRSIGPPVEFTAGVGASARYTLQLIPRGAAGLILGIFFGGDFKARLDYTSAQATSRPLFQMQGTISTGLGGVF
ncbi:MAG: peptidoglycan-binding protein [Pseudomonadota bacterium]|nr:peptidoglycan-binding protein [Pseudomonadota bacterium]